MEGDGNTQHSVTLETVIEHETDSVALRTIPDILEHGNNRLLVNCLLDEGSDTTYVNEDVVGQLGLHMGLINKVDMVCLSPVGYGV